MFNYQRVWSTAVRLQDTPPPPFWLRITILAAKHRGKQTTLFRRTAPPSRVAHSGTKLLRSAPAIKHGWPGNPWSIGIFDKTIIEVNWSSGHQTWQGNHPLIESDRGFPSIKPSFKVWFSIAMFHYWRRVQCGTSELEFVIPPNMSPTCQKAPENRFLYSWTCLHKEPQDIKHIPYIYPYIYKINSSDVYNYMYRERENEFSFLVDFPLGKKTPTNRRSKSVVEKSHPIPSFTTHSPLTKQLDQGSKDMKLKVCRIATKSWKKNRGPRQMVMHRSWTKFPNSLDHHHHIHS